MLYLCFSVLRSGITCNSGFPIPTVLVCNLSQLPCPFLSHQLLEIFITLFRPSSQPLIPNYFHSQISSNLISQLRKKVEPITQNSCKFPIFQLVSLFTSANTVGPSSATAGQEDFTCAYFYKELDPSIILFHYSTFIIASH